MKITGSTLLRAFCLRGAAFTIITIVAKETKGPIAVRIWLYQVMRSNRLQPTAKLCNQQLSRKTHSRKDEEAEKWAEKSSQVRPRTGQRKLRWRVKPTQVETEQIWWRLKKDRIFNLDGQSWSEPEAKQKQTDPQKPELWPDQHQSVLNPRGFWVKYREFWISTKGSVL